MLTSTSGNKVRLLWLGAAALLLIVLSVSAAWLFRPKAEVVMFARSPYGGIQKLIRFSEFRSAYLRANGGEEQLNALQSVRTSGHMESGDQSIPFFSFKRRPGQSLTTLKFPSYELSFGVDGDVVWQRVLAPGQEPQYELKTGQEAEALGEMGDFFDPIMRVSLFNEGTIERLSPSVWMGVEVIKLEFRTEEGGVPMAAYVDVETMQPIARVERFADGRERKVLYSDYRSVGGMQEPFKVETYLDDKLQSRVVVERSDPNVGAVASLFQYPAHLVGQDAHSAMQLESEIQEAIK